MKTLTDVFAETDTPTIHTLAAYLQEHVNAEWEPTFRRLYPAMMDAYPKMGEAVYAMYANALFKPIYPQLKEVGWRAVPRFPGNLGISREWGEDESNRQRWMWSKVVGSDGKAIGTIATIFYHDHVDIRIPRAFQMMGLDVATKRDIVAALSERSEDFKNALEANEEYALYLASEAQ
jgi:hypothetical protein